MKFICYFCSSIMLIILSIFIAIVCRSDLDNASLLVTVAARVMMTDLYPLHDVRHVENIRKIMSNENRSKNTKKDDIRIRVVSNILRDNAEFSLRIYEKEPGAMIYYKPDRTPKAVLVWFHGGGFVLGSAENDDEICFQFVRNAGFLVVNVDYRLAPEHKFPAAHDDASAALDWVYENIHKYGGDRNNIFIGGESAGGNLAAATVARNLDHELYPDRYTVPLRGLLLVYPPLEHGVYRDSHFLYRNVNPLLSMVQMQWFYALYLNDQYHDPLSYLASPIRTPDNILSQFPPTFTVVAKYDILLDESVEFAERIRSKNVQSDIFMYNNTIHGFFGRFGPGSKAVRDVCHSMLRVMS